jgi:hypothetical protein
MRSRSADSASACVTSVAYGRAQQFQHFAQARADELREQGRRSTDGAGCLRA